MRCSLLTLSSYLDDELSTERRGEVDAHLVGCQRCRNGVGYLEEEVARIGALDRVHVPDPSVYTLMQQLGLIGPEEMLPARPTPPLALQRDDTAPWMRAGSSRAALPWAPPRKADDQSVSVDRNQPALPFADIPLHQMSGHGAMPAPPTATGVPSLGAEDVEADVEAEVELDGRAFLDPGSEVELSAPAAAPHASAAMTSYDGGSTAAVEPRDPAFGSSAPALQADSIPDAHPTVPGDDASMVLPDNHLALPAHPPLAAFEPPAAAWSAPAPTAPVDSAPPASPSTAERVTREWSAWLPDGPEASVAEPEPVAPVSEIAPPPPVAPPPSSPGHDVAAIPVPRIDDLDDDAWSWAPRDHEQPNHPSLDPGPAPVDPSPRSRPAAMEPFDDSPDPLIDPLIARAAGPPPRPLRASAVARIRDQIALRLALARRGGRADDEVQIVSGHGAPERATPQRRLSRRLRPEDEVKRPLGSIESGGPIIAAARSREGYAAPERFDEPPAPEPYRQPAGGRAPTVPLSAFPEDALRAPGRHTRGLSFRRSPLANPQLARLAQSVPALAAAGLARGRAVIAHPRQRWIAGGVLVVLLLVIFLGLHRSSDTPAVSSNPALPSSAATAAPSHSAAASAPAHTAPVATVPPSAAPAIPQGQTYGDGGQGWQIQKIRYGVHPGDYRIVFDLAAAGAGATGSPTAAISFSDPLTMLVTYSGVVPPGSTGTPTPGGVVTAVAETQGSGGRVVIKFTLAHPVTFTGQYVHNPLRLVVDLH